MSNCIYTPAEIRAAAAPAVWSCSEISAELIEQWADYIDCTGRTFETYTANVRRFYIWLQAQGIKQPERLDVIRYRDQLEQDHKPATVHAYLIAVKLFFQWTESCGKYPDIAKRVKGTKVDTDYKKDPLTSSQAGRVLGSIHTDNIAGLRDYAIIALMLTTGLRTRSIILADIRDIKPLGEMTVLFYQGKGHKEKADYVKLSEPVLNAMMRYLVARGEPAPNEPLFASAAHRNAGERMTTRSVSRIVKEALRAAGLESERLTAHSLRHTAGTLAVKNGATLPEVQQLLGHKDINTTMIYLHIIKKEENTSTDRITSAIFG